MKSIALSVLLAVTSAASYAAPELMVFNDNWGTPKSRAEVQAELQAARVDGTAFTGGERSVEPAREPEGYTLTRAEVRAGLVGYVQPNGEAGAAAPLSSTDAARLVARHDTSPLQ